MNKLFVFVSDAVRNNPMGKNSHPSIISRIVALNLAYAKDRIISRQKSAVVSKNSDSAAPKPRTVVLDLKLERIDKEIDLFPTS